MLVMGVLNIAEGLERTVIVAIYLYLPSACYIGQLLILLFMEPGTYSIVSIMC